MPGYPHIKNNFSVKFPNEFKIVRLFTLLRHTQTEMQTIEKHELVLL